MPRMTPSEAKAALLAAGADLDSDFFQLPSEVVTRLLGMAGATRYVPPKQSGKSIARGYFDYLMRTARRS